MNAMHEHSRHVPLSKATLVAVTELRHGNWGLAQASSEAPPGKVHAASGGSRRSRRCAALREDEQDLAAFAERDREQPISYQALLAQLKAELRPFVACRASAEALVERWRRLPQVDPVRFRIDVDSVADSSV